VTSSEPVVLVDREERVTTITLNRPQARNALSRELMNALWDAIDAAGRDDRVDVVILTGTDPAFCAGVDLKEVAGEVPASAPTRPAGAGPERGTDGLFRFLPMIDKPVIGAINGVCVTGGLEIALQCTLLIASERARFADTHARVGVMPGGGLTVLAAQAIGLRRAIEMSLTGNFIGAEEALQLGLVNHVVAHDGLLPFAHQIAADIAGNDQVAVRLLLAHYRRIANATSLAEAHLIEGILAETWTAGVSQVGERREAVQARAREQLD
jgi:enoyl-CoA hydratase